MKKSTSFKRTDNILKQFIPSNQDQTITNPTSTSTMSHHPTSNIAISKLASNRSSSAPDTDHDSAILYGSIELGGTSVNLSIAKGDDITTVIKHENYPTTKPEETLSRAIAFFKQFPNLRAIGIASFGPIDLNRNSKTFGYIVKTPKPHWSMTEIVPLFKRAFPDMPIGWDTDVNAAALGELEWGHHQHTLNQQIHSCCYITVGTGIGAGVVCNSKPLHGASHPEAGHVFVKKHPEDDFEGSCVFHSSCVEGLASATAISKRLNLKPSQLRDLPDEHIIWDIVAFYLAQLCSQLTLIASPQCIILGGGVLKRKILFPKIRQHLFKLLNGYIGIEQLQEENINNYVVSSRFDHHESKVSAGIVGSLELARLAYHHEHYRH